MFAKQVISNSISISLAKISISLVVSALANLPIANAIAAEILPQSAQTNNLIARNPSPLADSRISTTMIDRDGRLWLGTWQGLIQIDQRTGKAIASISLPNSTVTALLEDSRGYFWVGTTSGLYQINPDSGKIQNIAIQLSSNRVLSLAMDRAGFIWVGTDQGLTRISPINAETYARLPNIPGTAANVMQIDNAGNIWVGTLDGLFKLNPGTAQITTRIPFVSGQIVQAIAVDPSGKIWAGTPRNVIEINPKTNKAIARINPVTGRDIVALATNKNGELWIGMREIILNDSVAMQEMRLRSNARDLQKASDSPINVVSDFPNANISDEINTKNLRDLLRRISYFERCTEVELFALIARGYRKHFDIGQVICVENDPSDEFYIILSGAVDVFSEKANQSIATLGEGEFFGEISLLMGIPRTATVRTLTANTVLFVVERQQLQKLLNEHKELGEQIAIKLSERQQVSISLGLLNEEELQRSQLAALAWIRDRLNSLFGISLGKN
jgi:CRP-like cAMP-binding protein/sugar lactone lactonase YvrE